MIHRKENLSTPTIKRYVVVLWNVSANWFLKDTIPKNKEENRQNFHMIDTPNKPNWMGRHEDDMEDITKEKSDFNLQESFVFF